MDHFNYKNGELFAENVRVADIVKKWGTPCYIYSRATLEHHWRVFDNALTHHPHLVCYAVKACSNIAILNVLAQLGSGFDVVSGGELERVLKAGGNPKKIVFSGVGKTLAEMARALEVGILCFNVESLAELERLNAVAKKLNKKAPVSLRINPDIDAKTHPYISTGLKENKFGIPYEAALPAYEFAAALSHLNIVGLDSHIGSQILELHPFIAATERMMTLKDKLKERGINIKHLDLGGGLGVRYEGETPPDPAKYAGALAKHINDKELTVIVEPGRVIAANAGILVTQVEYLKTTPKKNFAIVDAAMNDLIRPALYDAWHTIIPINEASNTAARNYDVVGPVCETGDFLGKDRKLAISEGDLLAIRGAGAYGFSMSSNYNSRPRAAEIMVDDEQAHLIRTRETFADLIKHEYLLK